MRHGERSWRAYWGLLSLTGYAKWKAGFIVLRSMLLTIAFALVLSFFMAGIVSVPLAFLFHFNPSMSLSIETDSDLAFAAMVVGLFIWVAPNFALSSLGGIRDELEKLTRDEGTFWDASYSSDSRSG